MRWARLLLLSGTVLTAAWLLASAAADPQLPAAGAPPAPAAVPDLVLFYSSETIRPGRVNEFVVKVGNAADGALEVGYDARGTHVVGSGIRFLPPPPGARRWRLRLVAEPLDDPGPMRLRGAAQLESATAPARGHALALFSVMGNWLPGSRMKLWAELHSPDGAHVHRSNTVTLRRPQPAS